MDTQYYTMRDALQELITRFFGPEDEPDDQTAKADSGKPKLTLVPRKPIYGMTHNYTAEQMAELRRRAKE